MATTTGVAAGERGGSVTDDSGRAAWLRGARRHLRHADPVLARLIDERPDFDPRAWMTPSQQEVLAIADKWRPYRSLATSYLFSAAFEPADAPGSRPPGGVDVGQS